ncbi:MAG: response regulator [Acidimicrobiia bacterium]
MAARILLVEDDEVIRETTRVVLEDEGYTVDEATTGEAALETFSRRPSDCVLLDLMLPGTDGFETCRALRRRSAVPIIMVTARSDTFDVVAGLEAGADDYVTKPFEPKELAARVRAHLRRARGMEEPSTVIRLGDELEVAPDEGVVRWAGEEVHLTRTEFRLLCELAANPGRVLTREILLERVWGYDYFGDGKIVDVHIYRLRAKIEADSANPRHLVTVRGLGYKVVP